MPPPQRHKAVMWMLAHLVDYHVQGQRRISLLDYIDFMRRPHERLTLARPDALQLETISPFCRPLPHRWTTHSPDTHHTSGRRPSGVDDAFSACTTSTTAKEQSPAIQHYKYIVHVYVSKSPPRPWLIHILHTYLFAPLLPSPIITSCHKS